jgi:hypothetical protein
MFSLAVIQGGYQFKDMAFFLKSTHKELEFLEVLAFHRKRAQLTLLTLLYERKTLCLP